MQFKYIAVALSSLLISGVKAAPMPNPEALENIEGNELIARSEQAKQAKQIGGPGGLDQFNGPGTSLMGLGNNNNGIGGNNYIDPSLLYGGGGGGNRFNPVSLYGGGGGGIPCNQCGGEQTGYCQWGQWAGQQCTSSGGNTYSNTEYSKDQRLAASNKERFSTTNYNQQPGSGWGNGGPGGFGFKA